MPGDGRLLALWNMRGEHGAPLLLPLQEANNLMSNIDNVMAFMLSPLKGPIPKGIADDTAYS